MENKSSKLLSWILILLIFLVIGLTIYNFSFIKISFNNYFKPKPGSCLILEEKYCRKVKLISVPWIDKGQIAVFNLPKGTIIFAPVDGNFSRTPSYNFPGVTEAYPGANILISKDGTLSEAEYIYDFIYFKNEEFVGKNKVKKGDKLASISEREITAVGNYNFIFTVEKYINESGPVKTEIDTDILNGILNVK